MKEEKIQQKISALVSSYLNNLNAWRETELPVRYDKDKSEIILFFRKHDIKISAWNNFTTIEEEINCGGRNNYLSLGEERVIVFPLQLVNALHAMLRKTIEKGE